MLTNYICKDLLYKPICYQLIEFLSEMEQSLTAYLSSNFLTKHFGIAIAVDHLDLEPLPGPNPAGKNNDHTHAFAPH